MAQTREQPASHVRSMPKPLAGAAIPSGTGDGAGRSRGRDTATTADEPAVDSGALRDAAGSIAFINSAQTEEIYR